MITTGIEWLDDEFHVMSTKFRLANEYLFSEPCPYATFNVADSFRQLVVEHMDILKHFCPTNFCNIFG